MDETTERTDTDPADVAPPVPQTRGLIDGSLNNLHMMDNSNLLGAMVSSTLESGHNHNANTRAERAENHTPEL